MSSCSSVSVRSPDRLIDGTLDEAERLVDGVGRVGHCQSQRLVSRRGPVSRRTMLFRIKILRTPAGLSP